MPPAYLDNHATTRVDPRVLDKMLPFFCEQYGNAASISHRFGWIARDAGEAARTQVAGILNAVPRTIIFTSGATEANNIALKGVMRAGPPDGHFITNAAEHRAILDPARASLKRDGYEVTVLPVDKYGRIDSQQVADAIRPNTVLASVMLANNEVGSINPIAEIGRLCRERGVLLHCDAVQAAGRIPIDVEELCVDLLSLTAHKMYGPKGVGALYVRTGEPRVRIEPLFHGGGHENRVRSGTLPVPLIVGFGEACALASVSRETETASIRDLRDRLWDRLRAALDGLHLNGHPEQRLAGNLNVSFEGVDGDALMASMKNIAVSSGSACTSADPEPSHVLRAMGRSDVLTRASLRFGIGRFNTDEEIDFAVAEVVEAVNRLRGGL